MADSANLTSLEQKAVNHINSHKNLDGSVWAELAVDTLEAQHQLYGKLQLQKYKDDVSAALNQHFHVNDHILGVDEKSKGVFYYDAKNDFIVRTAVKDAADWKIHPDRGADLGEKGSDGRGQVSADHLFRTRDYFEKSSLQKGVHRIEPQLALEIQSVKFAPNREAADFNVYSNSVYNALAMRSAETQGKIKPFTVVAVDSAVKLEVVLREPDGMIRRYDDSGKPDLVITKKSLENIAAKTSQPKH